jgi:hypothetical protein
MSMNTSQFQAMINIVYPFWYFIVIKGTRCLEYYYHLLVYNERVINLTQEDMMRLSAMGLFLDQENEIVDLYRENINVG